MKKIIFVGFIALLFLTQGFIGAKAQEIGIRPLQQGDIMAYRFSEDNTTTEIQILQSPPQESQSQLKYKMNQFWEIIAQSNDSTLIGGFPRRQEISFPSGFNLAFELGGSHFDANYTFETGLMLVTAQEKRSMSLDYGNYPAVILPNTTLTLDHASRQRNIVFNSTFTDYLTYTLETNQSKVENGWLHWYNFSLRITFENKIFISSVYNSPLFGDARVNITQDFTFQSGRVKYFRNSCNRNGCELDVQLDRTDFSGQKGWIGSIIDRATGIPDTVRYQNGRGFDVLEIEPSLENQKITPNFKTIQNYDDEVSYDLVYTNIEPIRIPVTSYLSNITFQGNTYQVTVIEDNYGDTSYVYDGNVYTSLSLLFFLSAIISITIYKRRKQNNN